MGGETEAQISGWTVDTLSVYLQRQVDDLRDMLNERYATQTKAVDAAFVASETAMRLAFANTERNVATALLSAKEAVTKAETATEKRFESVNEFRAQLSDQSATFVSRVEAEARRSEAETRITTLAEKISEVEARLTSRLDLNQGQDAGALALAAQRRAASSQVTAIVSVVLVALSISVALILGFNN